jgi:hypothetical protein
LRVRAFHTILGFVLFLCDICGDGDGDGDICMLPLFI